MNKSDDLYEGKSKKDTSTCMECGNEPKVMHQSIPPFAQNKSANFIEQQNMGLAPGGTTIPQKPQTIDQTQRLTSEPKTLTRQDILNILNEI